MRKFLTLIIVTLFLGILVACGAEDQADDNRLVVGVTAGPHEEIFEEIKKIAADEGLEIEIKVFSDYIMPNTALAEGDLDLNSYQHKPFMDQFNIDHDTNLYAYTNTFLSPIGVYSKEIESPEDIPEGAKIGIPNDPTNGARAFIIFEEAGFITLKEGTDPSKASILDVDENEKNLEFIELDAAQIPAQLNELDLGVINGNFALENGFDPLTDSILTEPSDTPFVNILAIREEDKDREAIAKVTEIYHSEEIAEFILERFEGILVPTWDY